MARKGRGAKGRRLPKALPRDQWDAVIDAAAEDRSQPILGLRDQAIVQLLFFSGIRCAELCALNVEDLAQWDDQCGWVLSTRLHVRHGKGDKERWVAVSPDDLDAVDAYLDIRPDLRADPKKTSQQLEGDLPLFVSRKRTSGGRLDESAVWRIAKRAGIEAGLPDFHTHRTRHSHGTRLLEMGWRIEEVADQLGHEDINTTRIYAQVALTKREEKIRGI